MVFSGLTVSVDYHLDNTINCYISLTGMSIWRCFGKTLNGWIRLDLSVLSDRPVKSTIADRPEPMVGTRM